MSSFDQLILESLKDGSRRSFKEILAKGFKAWRDMLIEFTEDTQRWLRDYHTRSVMETVNSTMKRVAPTPLRKKLIVRLATEILARICVYNIRQLAYLKYTHNIPLRCTSRIN